VAERNRGRRRGITIHRAEDAVPLQETDFMTAPEMSAESGRRFGDALAAGLGAGGTVDVLLRQQPEEGGFS